MVEPTVDPLVWLGKHLEEADTDLLREMVRTFIQALMSAEADAACGALYGERSPDRVNRRNGYRGRTFDTRTGTIELALPKLRAGSYFPEWLLEPRRRAERALVAVVAECYVKGRASQRGPRPMQALFLRRQTSARHSAATVRLSVRGRQFTSSSSSGSSWSPDPAWDIPFAEGATQPRPGTRFGICHLARRRKASLD